MKKRVLSVLLALTMLFASSVSTFAALNEYTAIGKAGAILDELNYDAVTEYGDWQKDMDYHAAQLETIENAYEAVENADLSAVVAQILEHSGLTENQKLYLCALAKMEENTDIADLVNSYGTAGLSWKDSFDKLQNFSEALGKPASVILVSWPSLDLDVEYDAILADSVKRARLASYVEETIKNLLRVAFSSTSTLLEDNYIDDIENSDITKKTLMVFASEVVEKEGIPFRTASSPSALASSAKDYALSFKNDANISMAKDAVDRVASADIDDTIADSFDEIAAAVVLVNNGYFIGRPVLEDIQLLAGDGVEDGIVETILKAVDNDFEATNAILNIALAEGVQLYNPVGRIDNLKENTAGGAFSDVTLSHEGSIIIKAEVPNVRGINIESITLKNSWFDVAFYKTNGTKLTGITYDDGTVSITKDLSKGVANAYMVLYRKDASGAEKAFIETYPVKVDFTDGIEIPVNPVRPSGSSSSSKYTITFNTNGGTEIAPKSYLRGSKVDLTLVVPTKDGYIFDGWYTDEELTNKVESITIDKNITLYAAWKDDEGFVVSKVEVPHLLEGDTHYAYVQGYPDGGIHPNDNITRAEAVTMIFRLLKDDVREANLTEENNFTDVNSENWFNTAVSTLAKLGLVEGRGENKFAPNENISRAEFATIFARLEEYEFVADSSYSDIAGHWAEKYIEEVDAYGWVAGYDDGSFRPNNSITRAEAMTLINRVLKRNPKTKDDLLSTMKTWTDNPETAWYYIAVQEATNSHSYERKNNTVFEKWTGIIENKDWSKFE